MATVMPSDRTSFVDSPGDRYPRQDRIFVHTLLPKLGIRDELEAGTSEVAHS